MSAYDFPITDYMGRALLRWAALEYSMHSMAVELMHRAQSKALECGKGFMSNSDIEVGYTAMFGRISGLIKGLAKEAELHERWRNLEAEGNRLHQMRSNLVHAGAREEGEVIAVSSPFLRNKHRKEEETLIAGQFDARSRGDVEAQLSFTDFRERISALWTAHDLKYDRSDLEKLMAETATLEAEMGAIVNAVWEEAQHREYEHRAFRTAKDWRNG